MLRLDPKLSQFSAESYALVQTNPVRSREIQSRHSQSVIVRNLYVILGGIIAGRFLVELSGGIYARLLRPQAPGGPACCS
jgi:hypothetical protein